MLAVSCRFKVDLQACLTRTSLPPGKRFLSLSERGTLEWPWLREQQIVSLQQFLKSSPSLDYATKVFDNINSRFAAHARSVTTGTPATCTHLPRHLVYLGERAA